ncbi:hypothetical protein JMUB6875_48240 [Nocardia sp. JMUB6875]
MRCTPGKRESDGRAPRMMSAGTDGKLIYDDRRSANAAAKAFEQFDGIPLRPYPCRRSRHGHFHLTTDGARMRRLNRTSGAAKDQPRDERNHE